MRRLLQSFLLLMMRLCPEQIWQQYRKRANDENKIKHLKEGFELASFNTDNLWATKSGNGTERTGFHNLIHYLNQNILNVKDFIEHLRTLRSKYFIIPSLLGSCSGYDVLRLSVNNRKLNKSYTKEKKVNFSLGRRFRSMLSFEYYVLPHFHQETGKNIFQYL